MEKSYGDTSKEAIGQRLGEVRIVNGWSQQFIARILDISPQRWNNYETGKTAPPPEVLAKIWQRTGATSDYILFNHRYGLPSELLSRLETRERNIRMSGESADLGSGRRPRSA